MADTVGRLDWTDIKQGGEKAVSEYVEQLIANLVGGKIGSYQSLMSFFELAPPDFWRLAGAGTSGMLNVPPGTFDNPIIALAYRLSLSSITGTGRGIADATTARQTAQKTLKEHFADLNDGKAGTLDEVAVSPSTPGLFHKVKLNSDGSKTWHCDRLDSMSMLHEAGYGAKSSGSNKNRNGGGQTITNGIPFKVTFLASTDLDAAHSECRVCFPMGFKIEKKRTTAEKLKDAKLWPAMIKVMAMVIATKQASDRKKVEKWQTAPYEALEAALQIGLVDGEPTDETMRAVIAACDVAGEGAPTATSVAEDFVNSVVESIKNRDSTMFREAFGVVNKVGWVIFFALFAWFIAFMTGWACLGYGWWYGDDRMFIIATVLEFVTTIWFVPADYLIGFGVILKDIAAKLGFPVEPQATDPEPLRQFGRRCMGFVLVASLGNTYADQMGFGPYGRAWVAGIIAVALLILMAGRESGWYEWLRGLVFQRIRFFQGILMVMVALLLVSSPAVFAPSLPLKATKVDMQVLSNGQPATVVVDVLVMDNNYGLPSEIPIGKAFGPDAETHGILRINPDGTVIVDAGREASLPGFLLTPSYDWDGVHMSYVWKASMWARYASWMHLGKYFAEWSYPEMYGTADLPSLSSDGDVVYGQQGGGWTLGWTLVLMGATSLAGIVFFSFAGSAKGSGLGSSLITWVGFGGGVICLLSCAGIGTDSFLNWVGTEYDTHNTNAVSHQAPPPAATRAPAAVVQPPRQPVQVQAPVIAPAPTVAPVAAPSPVTWHLDCNDLVSVQRIQCQAEEARRAQGR